MRRPIPAFALMLTLLLSGFSAQAAQPAKISANYALFKDGLEIGAIQETFSSDGKRYKVTSVSTPVGLAAAFIHGTITVNSSGMVTPQGLRPDQASYTRSDKPEKNLNATLDWNMRLLRMQYEGGENTVALEPGTQDRLSVMYQFTFLKPADLKTLTFPMTNGRSLETYRYQLAGTEKIDLPFGRIDTLHLVRQGNADDNRVEVWLARDRRLFPVRLLIVENGGSRLEQTLTRLEFK
jgi:hypothetical protein